MHDTLIAALVGTLSGLALGLTGSGGSLLAVPLLVALGTFSIADSIALSLFGIALSTLTGIVIQFQRLHFDWRIVTLLAATGALGSPLGALVGAELTPTTRWIGLALLMLIISLRMWVNQTQIVRAAIDPSPTDPPTPFCRYDPQEIRFWTSRCITTSSLIGIGTGVLAGLFGVGGGFLLVPAMTQLLRIPIRRAIANSMVIIGIISISGAIAHSSTLLQLDLAPQLCFPIGGALGFWTGHQWARHLATSQLQRIFAGLTAVLSIGMLLDKFLFAH